MKKICLNPCSNGMKLEYQKKLTKCQKALIKGLKKYRDFFLHCLDCGMVINPNYDGDSIVPFAADKGVFSKLAKNPFEI